MKRYKWSYSLNKKKQKQHRTEHHKFFFFVSAIYFYFSLWHARWIYAQYKVQNIKLVAFFDVKTYI